MKAGVLVLGDVGAVEGEVHIGDEAMALATRQELEQRGIHVAAFVSADPDDTLSRYGVAAIPRLGFDNHRTSSRWLREARLDRILSAARGEITLAEGDPAVEVIERVRVSSGLVISGGGNLSSLWPEHIYERNAFAAIASAFSVPVIVTGQMIGPALVERDGQLVAELLSKASLVGVRDTRSLALARALGVPANILRLTRDDALWLEGDLPTGLPAGYCAVTVARHSGLTPLPLLVEALAHSVDRLVELTELPAVFLPHVGGVGGAPHSGDQLVHAAIAEAGDRNDYVLAPIFDPRQAAAVSRGASFSLSTRYHPTVFASASGVPSIGIFVDAYTGVKISGALELAGLSELAQPSAALAGGLLDEVLASTWSARGAIREHSAELEPVARGDAERWWDNVAAVLSGLKPQWPSVSVPPSLTVLDPVLSSRTERLGRWQVAESELVEGALLARDEARPADDQVAELERRVGASQAALADAEQRIHHAEAALAAARALAAEVAEPMFEARLGDERAPHPTSELEALLNTRTFRWTARARSAYGRVRAAALRARRMRRG